jgi:hypothetical protein
MSELDRLKQIESAARALVDAFQDDRFGMEDVTQQVDALAEALDANKSNRNHDTPTGTPSPMLEPGGFVCLSASAGGGLTVVARGGSGSAGHASKEAKP